MSQKQEVLHAVLRTLAVLAAPEVRDVLTFTRLDDGTIVHHGYPKRVRIAPVMFPYATTFVRFTAANGTGTYRVTGWDREGQCCIGERVA